MTMRKYIVTIHEDGSITAVECKDYEKEWETAQWSAFERGYMTALFESRKKVLEFKKSRENSREANLIYAAVASVHDFVKSRMCAYEPKRHLPLT